MSSVSTKIAFHSCTWTHVKKARIYLLETIKPEENQQSCFREKESIIVIHSQALNLSSWKLTLSLWFLSLILDGGI